MHFKEHPIFDNSPASDWFELTDSELGDDELLTPEMEPFARLIQVYRDHQKYLEQKVLDRITRHVGEPSLAYVGRNEVLFAPLGDHGFQLYFQLYFRETDGPSADSDYWWAIVYCGNVFDERFGPDRKRHWNVVELGWTAE